MNELRVVTVAPNSAARVRLANAILASDAGLGVAAELSDLDELVATDLTPEVIVVETGSERSDRIRAVRRAFPSAVLVAVVSERDRKRLRSALAEGADGIVVRDRLEAIGVTIRAAHAGQVTVPRELRTSLVRPSLSVREKQVLGMVVLGFTNGEIARQLVLAESTIKSHLSSAFTKLGVTSRGEATSLILDPANGLGPGILSIAGVEEKLGPDLTIDAPSLAQR